MKGSVRTKWLRQCCLLLLPVLGLLELGAHFYFARRAPRFDDYHALLELVRSLRESGDIVRVAPSWAEPMVRGALGDSMMPLRDLGQAELGQYQGAIEVTAMGQRDPELRSWSEVERRVEGPFVVRRLTNSAFEKVRFDFVDALGPAVKVSIGNPSQLCRYRTKASMMAGGLAGHPTFPARRFDCPGGDFFNVGVTVIADEAFRPRRCLWAHPPDTGALRISYSSVDLGERIVGHGGMYWVVERERKGAPVRLDLRVNGDHVGQYVHRDGDGWSKFEFELGKHAQARNADLVFEVSTSNYRHRHFCFEARAL